MTASSRFGGGRLPKDKRFKTLTEIMVMALQTGEHRSPGFREEIIDIVDEVCAEEIEQIRMIADYERRLMVAELEILRLEAEHAIDMRFAQAQIKLERCLADIFRKMTINNIPDNAAIRKEIAAVDTDINAKHPSELVPQADAAFDKSQRQRLTRLEGLFRRMMPGYRGPKVL